MLIQVLPFVFLSILGERTNQKHLPSNEVRPVLCVLVLLSVVFLCLTFVHWSSIGCSFEEMPTNKYVESR
jgi:hypothetical protein